MGNFADDVQAFVHQAERNMDLVVRKIALEMFTKVVLRSPVDKGRFRANWQVAIGTVPSGKLEIDDPTGVATISKIEAAALSLKAGDTIVLVNNLPYGPRLENGHSQQAPAGMVGLTVQEFGDVVRKAGLELVQI